MQENLLMEIELRKNSKKWRNIAILLAFVALLFSFKSNPAKKKNENVIAVDHIARIKIDNIITKDDYRDKKLKEVLGNKNIKAVIVVLDTPGGEVVPSEILYEILREINAKKPIVVTMEGMAASGGYMIALASDYIIARNTTLTGSIGVLMQSYEVVRLAEKLGIDLKTYKSTPLKGMPSPTEKNNSESDVVLNEMIKDVYGYFTELVKTRRKLTDENYKKAINGQAFTGRQAFEIGLVDEIGGEEEALKYLETKNVDTKLPIHFVDLKKKTPVSLMEKLISSFFFNIEERATMENMQKLMFLN